MNGPPERDSKYSHHKIVKRDQRFATGSRTINLSSDLG